MSAAADDTRVNIFFTSAAQGGVPQDQPAEIFECSETIYGVVDLYSLTESEHSLKIIWIDPKGKSRERNEIAFTAHQPHERLWAWLKLHRPLGGSVASVIDPAIGMRDFIGEWEVEFQVDGKRIETGKFKVIC